MTAPLRVVNVKVESDHGTVVRADRTVLTITLSRNETAEQPVSPMSDDVHEAVVDWINYNVELEG